LFYHPYDHKVVIREFFGLSVHIFESFKNSLWLYGKIFYLNLGDPKGAVWYYKKDWPNVHILKLVRVVGLKGKLIVIPPGIYETDPLLFF